MYFALWALGAAATFLYGCYSKQEPVDKNSNSFRNRKIHTNLSLPKPVQPSRRYISEFGNNLEAAQAFRGLTDQGVTAAQLDIGCDFPNTSLIGKEDYRVEACEIDEFLFANYQKYKKVFEGRTQPTTPWDPGVETVQKIKNVIEFLKQSDALKNFSPTSDEYREKLAIALLHFALIPDQPEFLKNHHSEWRKNSSQLKSIGLENFQKKLLTEGGLGVSLWKNDNQGVTDGAAHAALQTKIGDDFAKNHLLFAIFEQAQLNPFFAKVDLTWKNIPLEDKVQQGKGITVYRTSTFYVGVTLQKQDKLFNLALEPQENPKEYKKLPLKIYYSNYLSWRGANAALRDHHKQAIEFFQKSLEFNPKSYTAHNSYGLSLLQKGNKQRAELALKRSIDLNPRYHFAFENLGDLYWGQEKTAEALENYYNAVKANPRWVKTFSKDKLLERMAQVLKKDPDNTMAKSIRREIEMISLVNEK